MKRIAFVISLLASCTIARAQQDYFVFFWADNQQPFYVRLNEKTYSSSAIGHLVISRLKDSTYNLVVGFPKKQFPEKTYIISFKQKDLDYQLKYSPEEGWVLVNAQTSETVRPRQDLVKNTNSSLGERKTGQFATLMSGIVNDSAVLYKTIVKVEAPVPQPLTTAQPAPVTGVVAGIDSAQATTGTLMVVVDTTTKVAATDTAKMAGANGTAIANPPVATIGIDSAVATAGVDTAVAAKQPVATPARPSIVQLQERSGDTAKELIFADSSAAGTDTISVVIDLHKKEELPAPGEVIAAPAKIDSVKAVIATPDTSAVREQTVIIKDKDSAQATTVATAVTTPDTAVIVKAAPKDSAIVKADSTATAKKTFLLMNSDCVNFASEHDVDKLRVKMLSAANVDDRIGLAKKIFKTKCFVTRYIRGLSELFPNDEGRFKFFDAAYPFVSDTGNFRSLLDLFTDELYIARFKALVRM
ncbi:DUF4476 domain-containing protein [Pseudoflavitalea sp. X16]|uniref:DUF4476 domain-containing protein n=1 Tax=Paraflavitalea devenefica TaxID=2716334 RepID=UPI001422F387|nr:DUF4476 domain-containing protein [Paraflavitalea devenefica]NII25349.1 DUF4476 domain-containing protein [Paraflavitalea devenefica]